jgi:hypothetical protein
VPKYWEPSQHALPWEITGNSVFFRIHSLHNDPVTYSFGSRYSMMTAYGDFESYVIGDSHNFLIHGSGIPTSNTLTPSYYGEMNQTTYKTLCRSYSGSSIGVTFTQVHCNMFGLGFGSRRSSLNYIYFPHDPDHRFLYKKDVMIFENNSAVVRGKELGIAQCLHINGPDIYEHGRVVTLNDIPYRMSVFNCGNTSTDYTGLFMQPIVGPW